MQDIARGRRQHSSIIISTLILTLGAGAVRAGNAWVHSSRGDKDTWPTRTRTMKLKSGDDHSVSTMSWHEVGRAVRSPEDISTAVKKRVQYSRDMFKEDEWRSGRDTWDRGKGDCEDYAAAVKDLCSEKGIKAEIYVVQSKTAREAHAVTMGESHGRVWVSSNGSYKEYNSLYDAKQELARDLGWWAPDTELFEVKQSQTDGGHQYVKTATYTSL